MKGPDLNPPRTGIESDVRQMARLKRAPFTYSLSLMQRRTLGRDLLYMEKKGINKAYCLTTSFQTHTMRTFGMSFFKIKTPLAEPSKSTN